MSRHHVVVGETVHQQQWAFEVGRQWEQARCVVRSGVDGGVAEVTLGVVGVVEALFGDRSAGNGGVEHIGPAQDSERCEVGLVKPSCRHVPGG